MTIEQLLIQAAVRLKAAESATPRLDAEVLLGHVLGRDRTWLYTWSDRKVEDAALTKFEALLDARIAGEPIAYLIGEREFWGLRLQTHAASLIPRPDTECLVEAALFRATEKHGRALDLGTGSGAIALAFASERRGWQVTGVDRIADALALAQANAERLDILNVEFIESDWFSALADQRFELILANPPYLAPDDPHLEQGDVRFEPRSALVAAENGLADLRHLIVTAGTHLEPQGWLLLEHGWTQGEAVGEALCEAGYTEVATLADLAGQPRVSLGRYAY
ncbi:peptide chain release factor N(5)-glutamine methyltransferase [Halomonas sp. M20]|uniref:peptide chain release factor N(5)-glutamine methyltransferase n=1 Tax=Halomonas sp. M20 TaxID=2763264 RepID=UPI001D0AF8BC|nr:peptide chain release factor N(5)-glutamine methyltransferase [Halomonas sp. M20]